MTYYLVDLDNTLLHTFKCKENGKISFYWTSDFEKDFKKPVSILDELFQGMFLVYLQTETNLGSYVSPFLEKYGLQIKPDAFIDYWLSRDNNLNQDCWQWICNQKRKGHRFSIASNQPEIRMQYLWQHRPEWHTVFDHVFTSARLGVGKPDPTFFLHIQKQLQTSFQNICLIDDSSDNCQTAHQLGMDAILFRTAEDLP